MIRQKDYRGILFALACMAGCASPAESAGPAVLTYVTIPVANNKTSGNIQTNLVSTFPNGIFTANNALATPFDIPGAPGDCGTSLNAPCNFFAFLPGSAGSVLTIDTSLASPTDIYTLLNATSPAPGQELASIKFVGTGGASLSFPLVAGKNIRDYYQGAFANTLSNGISGVEASNAFTCSDPAQCLGSGGTGNVKTGSHGNYVIDEQHFSLGATFAGKTLTQIVITNLTNQSRPLLLGITAGASPGVPAIAANGVVSASAFGGFSFASPGSWIEIYGSNLAAGTQVWGSADFHDEIGPTSLGGTTVAIGGKAAFIDYVSPGQIDAQVPSDAATGSQHMTVTTGAGTSAAFPFTVNATAAGLLAPASFQIGGVQYAVALFADGTYVLPEGAIAGVNSRPAKAGDTIVLYGVGFGPVHPAVPAGQIVQATNSLASSFELKIGGTTAMVDYQGLAPGYVGLYQFNVVVPPGAAGPTAPLSFTLGGVTGTQTLSIAVGK